MHELADAMDHLIARHSNEFYYIYVERSGPAEPGAFPASLSEDYHNSSEEEWPELPSFIYMPLLLFVNTVCFENVLNRVDTRQKLNGRYLLLTSFYLIK